MKPNYDVITIDLSVERLPTSPERVAFAAPVESITVQQLDSPAGISLGPNAFIPARSLQTFDMCPSCDEGIFITNAVGVGFLVLIANFGGLRPSNV